MTFEEAKLWLKPYIEHSGGLWYHRDGQIVWNVGDWTLSLDGRLTLDILEAMVVYCRAINRQRDGGMSDNTQILTWDYREQPDWEAIREAMQALQLPDMPYFHVVENTGDDQYALIIAEKSLSSAECEAMWTHYRDAAKEVSSHER
jgi:hypothetical protein